MMGQTRKGEQMPTAKKKDEELKVKRIDVRTVLFELQGVSPLVMHKWSEKAKKEMRDKQQKKARRKSRK